MKVPLTQEQFAVVDDDVGKFVSQWKWCAAWNKTTESYYAQRAHRFADGTRRMMFMHSFIGFLLGIDGPTIDHRNHDTLDNRGNNLRAATPSEQIRNQRKRSSNTSGYIGVSWSKDRNKWLAVVGVNGKNKNLGRFDDPISAAWVRDNYVREHHGEFAVFNNQPERRSRVRLN